MAGALTAQMHLSSLVLNDRWPGAVNPNQSIPTGGWDNTTDNFTTTSANQVTRYPVGTKIMAYTDNTYCAGYYTMMYLMFHSDGSDTATSDISADFSDGNMYCAHSDSSDAEKANTDFSVTPYYVVTRCFSAGGGVQASDITSGAPLAIPCATLNCDGTGVQIAGYGDCYAWFWVGGVCPCADATLMQGTAGSLAGADVSVETLMRRGPVMACFSGTTIGFLSLDVSNIADTTTLAAEAGVLPIMGIHPPIGWACTSAV